MNLKNIRTHQFILLTKSMNFFNSLVVKVKQINEKLATPVDFIPVAERVYHCSFPKDPKNFKASLHNQLPHHHIQIINLSEYSYQALTQKVFNQAGIDIMQHTYEYYTSMPLTLAITQVHRIKNYLGEDPHNAVLIHCQQGMTRSVVFLASYLYLTAQQPDVASSLQYVARSLGTDTKKAVCSSQHSILRNIAHFHQDPACITREHLRIVKVIMNQAPTISEIHLTEEQPLRVCLEIRKEGKLVFKKVHEQFGLGEILHFNLGDEKIVLSDDCLFAFKYIQGKTAYPAVRIQFNTNFVFNSFLRVQMQQMDISRRATCKGQVFTDFLFETLEGTQSDLFRATEKNNVDIVSHYLEKKQFPSKSEQRPQKSQLSKPLNINSQQIQKIPGTPCEDNEFQINDEEDNHNDSSAQKLNQILNKLVKKHEAEEEVNDERDQPSPLEDMKEILTLPQNQNINKDIPEQLQVEIAESQQLQNEKQKLKQKNNAAQIQRSGSQSNKEDLNTYKIDTIEIQNIQKQNSSHKPQNLDKQNSQREEETQVEKEEGEKENKKKEQRQEQEVSQDEEVEEEVDLDDYLAKLQEQAEDDR